MKDYHFKNSFHPLKYKNTYSESDAKIIAEGFIAPTMDDRWDLIYSNRELNIYRSWTGIGIFKLQFEELDGSLIVNNAFVDEEFLSNYSEEYCSMLMNWLIEFILFSRRADMPQVELSNNELDKE